MEWRKPRFSVCFYMRQLRDFTPGAAILIGFLSYLAHFDWSDTNDSEILLKNFIASNVSGAWKNWRYLQFLRFFRYLIG
jgi:hypothetical protein